jgi:hypothetical protein
MRSYAISIRSRRSLRSIMGRSSLRSFGEVSYCTGRPALGDRQRGQLDLVLVSKIPDANPMKPLLRAIEHSMRTRRRIVIHRRADASNQRPAPPSSIATSRTSHTDCR